MEIFILLFLIGFIWFLIKLFSPNKNIFSSEKYRSDLAKQKKELEDLRKPSGDNANDNWWTSGNRIPEKEPKKEPEIKKGKRGGRYTEDKTKDGRPYRRYF